MTRARSLLISCAGLALAVVAGTTMASASAGSAPSVLVDGLDGPRGLDVSARGHAVVAEADGTISRIYRHGHKAGTAKQIGKVPAEFVAPSVALGRHGKVWVLTVGGEQSSSASLFLLTPGEGRTKVKDIAKWSSQNWDPFDIENDPVNDLPNPYNVAAGPWGSALVADAANNAVVQVWPNGKARLVARVKPRVVDIPEPLQEEGGPTETPAEAVTTSVAMGADGSVYIGELRGYPATPGTSQIWRVAPGKTGVICDPARPYKGACTRFADGLTSVISVDTGRAGSVYAAELSKQSWLAIESDPPIPGSEVGSVYRFSGHKGKYRTELSPGEVILPGAVAAGWHGKAWVSGPIFGPPGSGSVYRVTGSACASSAAASC